MTQLKVQAPNHITSDGWIYFGQGRGHVPQDGFGFWTSYFRLQMFTTKSGSDFLSLYLLMHKWWPRTGIVSQIFKESEKVIFSILLFHLYFYSLYM